MVSSIIKECTATMRGQSNTSIEYATKQSRRFLWLLDNGTVLSSSLDDIFKVMEAEGLLLAGPHDVILTGDGGYFRYSPLAIHASLMILRPTDIKVDTYPAFIQVRNKYSRTSEPYHGLTYIFLRKVLYLKPHIV